MHTYGNEVMHLSQISVNTIRQSQPSLRRKAAPTYPSVGYILMRPIEILVFVLDIIMVASNNGLKSRLKSIALTESPTFNQENGNPRGDNYYA